MEKLRDMTQLDYHDAVREMHKGNVVKYIGTINGNVWTDRGGSFCMCRGCIFLFDGGIKWNKLGPMIYDPGFRYELTGQAVDTRAWKPYESTEDYLDGGIVKHFRD